MVVLDDDRYDSARASPTQHQRGRDHHLPASVDPGARRVLQGAGGGEYQGQLCHHLRAYGRDDGLWISPDDGEQDLARVRLPPSIYSSWLHVLMYLHEQVYHARVSQAGDSGASADGSDKRSVVANRGHPLPQERSLPRRYRVCESSRAFHFMCPFPVSRVSLCTHGDMIPLLHHHIHPEMSHPILINRPLGERQRERRPL